MNASNLGLIEMIFTFGCMVVFIGWQFYSLNRDNKKAAKEKAEKLAVAQNTLEQVKKN